MLKVTYNKENNETQLKIYGEDFQEMLDSIKSSRAFSYEPKSKLWIGSCWRTLDFLDTLSENEFEIHDLSLIKEQALKETQKETQFFRNKIKEENFVYPPIKGKHPFEDFQLTCIERGVKQNRLGLFLKMGLGKTYIICTVLNHFFQDQSVDKLLIVVPPEGVYNWRKELLKFSNFVSHDEILISKAHENRNPLEMEDLNNYKVIIMTYRHFLTLSDDWYKIVQKKRSSNYRKGYIPFEKWGEHRAIILDESHNIKNKFSRTAKVLHYHKHHFEYRYVMTGTPTPNIFTEIYSQVKFLDSNIIKKDYYEWISEIADIGNRFSEYAINKIYDDKVKEVEEILEPLVIRYGEEVLDLPELYIQPIYCEMTDTQKKIYEAMVNQVIIQSKENRFGMTVQYIKNRFAYISLAYENACLLKDKKFEYANYQKYIDKFKFDEKHHGKLEICDSLLEEYLGNNEKVVLFDFHPLTLNQLSERYKKYNPIIIHGQNTPKGEEKIEWRSKELDTFRESDKHNLLIGSFKVLSTAINLVECHKVIYFSRNFSYVDWSQSIKRFHRLGQEKNVIIHPLIFENSLDEILHKSLENKKALDDSIFKGKEYLTKDEWKCIFLGKGDIE